MSVVSCPVARRCFFFTHLLESNWLASWLASLISCVRVSLISLFARTCHSCALLSHVWVCMLCSVCSVRFLFCFATGATCICSCAWIFAGRGRARSSWPLRVMKNKEKGKAGRWQPGLGAPPWGENADLELRSRRGCLQSLNRNRCSDCEVMAAAVWEHTACQPSSKENSNETAAKGSSIRIRMASKGQVSLCEPRIHACLRICPNMPPYAPHGPLHTLDVLIYPDILSHTQSQRERERELRCILPTQWCTTRSRSHAAKEPSCFRFRATSLLLPPVDSWEPGSRAATSSPSGAWREPPWRGGNLQSPLR